MYKIRDKKILKKGLHETKKRQKETIIQKKDKKMPKNEISN